MAKADFLNVTFADDGMYMFGHCSKYHVENLILSLFVEQFDKMEKLEILLHLTELLGKEFE